MKRLEKLLLINWHYIVHDLLNVEEVTFLTGKNGAGKSTILDALQTIILGDTSGYFFNKAANDNSRRSLKGYLFGEVGDQEDKGVVYLRGAETFSSYVVAEFFDTVKKKRFCMGVVFDCEADGSHTHRFFSLQDELPAFHFIRDGIPLGIHDLRQWGAKHGKGKLLELYDTNKRYQDMFRSLMGNIGEKFFRLFKKAVPFSPIMDVAGFISEFVCDVEHRLDIDDMRENIRHYRRMEAELGYVQRKVAALTKIAEHADNLSAVVERLRVYQYLLDRARVAESESQLKGLEETITRGEARLAELGDILQRDEARREDLQAQRDVWQEERARSDVYATQQRLESRKQVLEAEFASLGKALHRQERFLLELTSRWTAVKGLVQQAIAWTSAAEGLDLLSELRAQLYDGHCAIESALDLVRNPVDLTARGVLSLDAEGCRLDIQALQQAQGLLTNGADRLHDVHRSLQRILSAWQQERRDLETTIAELKKGIKPYDSTVTLLQQVIADRLLAETGKSVPVTIFAEALEIPDATWHKAIEGYLHTQRFYLLVPPEHFTRAVQIYDEVKKDRHIYDVGIVDVGRILEQRPERLSGSLAEEIVTEDKFARVYADFLLGRVMKAARVETLREHRTAVTQDGMLYQNFVVRQMDPKRWENLFIGKRALAEQLSQKTARLEEVSKQLAMWAPRLDMTVPWSRLQPPSEGDMRDVTEAQESLQRIPPLQAEFKSIVNEIGNLDLSYLLALDEKLEQCRKQIKEVEEHHKVALREQAEAESQVRYLRSERRPTLERELAEATRKVRDAYDDAFIGEVGQPRFQQELQRLQSPSAILTNFGRTMQGEVNRKENLWAELVSLRGDYNRDFQAGFDIQRSDNDAYAAELRRLVDSQLTEYAEKIKQAKERAQIQFQEDFVSKLQSNIYTVEGQIRDLNAALRGISFGRDQYRFQVSPNPQYSRFYQMIMDELLMEGFGLFSQSFQEKHGDVVEELFRNIIDVDESDAYAMTELEKNLEKFTDYRTYLNFDLIVKDEEGRESRLSRVIAKKSGGETQTPFYISVLASFVQLYRVGRAGSDNTLRLIVFDEAYSKMDHQRIRESVKLIRDLGLQVILSAPTEKLADIAPLVDRTLIVTRVQSHTKVLEFDMAKETVRA